MDKYRQRIMEMKLREVKEKHDIIKEFSHLHTDRSKVLLWQNVIVNGEKKKTIIFCELKSISQNYLFLSSINQSAKDVIKQMVKSENTIFIRGTLNGVMFKSEKFSLSENLLRVPIPKRIMLSERRAKKRYLLGLDKKIEMTFRGIPTNQNKKETKTFLLNDFSKEGAAIQLKRGDAIYMEVGKYYSLQSINGITLPPNFKAKVVYHKVHTYFKNSGQKVIFKAGLHFSKKLPKEIFQDLMDIHLSILVA